MNETTRYQRARQWVSVLKSFYTHLTVYLLVNVGLLLLNLITSPGEFWFYWPLLGWGIGVAIHALNVFGIGGLFGSAWEERQMRKLMDQEE